MSASSAAASRHQRLVPEGTLLLRDASGAQVLTRDGLRVVLTSPNTNPQQLSRDGSQVLVITGPHLMTKPIGRRTFTTFGTHRIPAFGIVEAKLAPSGRAAAYSDLAEFSAPHHQHLCILSTAGSAPHCLPHLFNNITDFDWSPTGRQIVIAGERALHLVDVENGTFHRIPPPGSGTQTSGLISVAWSPSGRYIAATGQLRGEASPAALLFRPDGSLFAKLRGPGAPDRVTWSKHDILAYTTDAKDLHVFDPRTRFIRRVLRDPHPTNVCSGSQGVEWSPSGRWLAFLNSATSPEGGRPTLHIFDGTHDYREQTLELKTEVSELRDWGVSARR